VTPEVEVALVRPSRAANVAAACRAMKNMGLRKLWLVGTPPLLAARPDARSLAYGAWDVLDGAHRVDRLEEALAAGTFVVGTSGRPVAGHWTPRRLAAEAAGRAGSGALVLVFGPEASGLRNDELALCHETVHIPTDVEQPSLNLAQAVLLLAYELRLASREAAGPDQGSEPRASVESLERALSALEQGLVGIGYLNPQQPGFILSELRRLLARARPTPREVTLLLGMARQIRWAAGRIAKAASHRP
jgi:TrmH family RNA methyltransferase